MVGNSRRWLALAIGMLAVVLNVLDFSVVSVAVPRIRADLGASAGSMQFVVTAYSIAFVLTLLVGGRLGDFYGRRRLFLVGTAGFAIASALAAAAWGVPLLILARLAQGGFAGLMVPQVLATIAVSFRAPWGTRIAAFSPYGVVVPVTAPVAPLLGQYVTDWRLIFGLNAGLAALTWLATLTLVPEWVTERAPSVFPAGALAAGLGALLLIMPLTAGRALGWPPWVAGPLLVGLILLGVVALLSRRRSVALHLFGQRRFAVGMLAILVLAAGILGFFPFFATFLRAALGYSALDVSFLGLGWALGVVAGSAVACLLVPRAGKPVLIAGALIAIAGMAFVPAALHAGTSVAIPLLVSGFGKGLIDRTLSRVDDPDTGSAAGILLLVQQIGGAVGLAVVGTAVAAVLTGHAAAADARLSTVVDAAGVPATARAATIASLSDCVRLRAANVSADPPAELCPGLDDTPAGRRLDAAATDEARRAYREAFTPAVTRGVQFEIGLLATVLLLLLLFPGSAFPRSTTQEVHDARDVQHLPGPRAPLSRDPAGVGIAQRRP